MESSGPQYHAGPPAPPPVYEHTEPAVTSNYASDPDPQPAPARKSQGDWKWFIAAAVVAGAFTAGAFVAASDNADPAPEATAVAAVATTTTTTTTIPETTTPPTTVPPLDEPAGDASTLLLDASLVGDVVIPSVVTVQVYGASFGGGSGVLGSGSGVVFDDQGHILTNDHVVATGSSYEIVLSDGRIYPAELVGTDPTTDLAVLSVEAVDLPPIAVGSSDALTVGDPAVAVGSPLGLDGGPSLTVGVISAFGREVQTDATTRLYGMLQTDAPITQGSSGGALVDASGRLVGITTAVGVSEVGIEGIGFATPIEIVTRVTGEILANGSASDPFLGIFGATSLEDTPDGGSIPVGVVIDSVEPNTAAEAAGLASGDVISALNGVPIKTMDELVSQIRRYGAESTIQLTLGNGQTLDITLGERPST